MMRVGHSRIRVGHSMMRVGRTDIRVRHAGQRVAWGGWAARRGSLRECPLHACHEHHHRPQGVSNTLARVLDTE